MAGSRVERFGSIYRRVKGLLRSGAVKYEDRPLWLDVYEAFPPKRDPVYTETEPTEPVVRDILYQEDTIRALFYKVYGNPDVIDLANSKTKSICQKFVDHYQHLQSVGSISEADLFQQTTNYIKGMGIRLRTMEERNRDRASIQANKTQSYTSSTATSTRSVLDSVASPLSSAAVFGGIAREARDDEDWIEEPEDLTRTPSDDDR